LLREGPLSDCPKSDSTSDTPQLSQEEIAQLIDAGYCPHRAILLQTKIFQALE
jgi:hypothetical protein